MLNVIQLSHRHKIITDNIGGQAKTSRKSFITSPKLNDNSVLNEEKEVSENGSGTEAAAGPEIVTGTKSPNEIVPSTGADSLTSPASLEGTKPSEGTGIFPVTAATITNNNVGNEGQSSGTPTSGTGNIGQSQSTLTGSTALGITVN